MDLTSRSAVSAVAFIITICAFFAAAIVWAFFGHLDINATAAGKIESVGHTKVIEALESGKISAIHVETGGQVHAGDLLLEFEAVEASADFEAAKNAHVAALAESARRIYAIKLVYNIASAVSQQADQTEPLALTIPIPSASTDITWDTNIPEPLRLREWSDLKADLAQLSSTIGSLDKQTTEKQATQNRLQQSIENEKDLLVTLSQVLAMRQDTVAKLVGTKTSLFEALAEVKKAQGQLASDQGQLKEAMAALESTFSEKRKILSQFLDDYQTKLSDAQKRGDDAIQAVNKASPRLQHTKLYSPVDGFVQKLAATTVGQVFTTGQQIMVIAPEKPRLQIEALVPNTDIGFLHIGQSVVVKVDAFPFTRFGTVSGHIVQIAREAVEEQDAKRQLVSAVSAANEASSGSGAPPGQAPNFVFPITIALDQRSIPIDGVDIPLSSGMTVVAEIRTGQRRIIDYVLSPLTKISSEAFKER
jgi:hemolysin D